MKNSNISRRTFALLAGTAGTGPLALMGAEPLTAQLVAERIQSELGGEWPAAGPDGFKAGEPSTVVKGIATTSMATLDVLKQAVKTNANLILTYEPTFYGRQDAQPRPAAAAGTRAGRLWSRRPRAQSETGIHREERPGGVSPARSLAGA